MDRVFEYTKIAFGTIGSVLGWYFGEMDGLLYVLIAFAIIDYATGVAHAITNKTLSSQVGFKGIMHKVFMFALVGIGNLLDIYLIKNGSVFRTAIVFYYLGNEGLSILENVALLGLPIPTKLKDVLEQLKQKGENDECDE